MLRQSFTDFIFATNTDGSGKAASYVRALDMPGPVLTKHCGVMWGGGGRRGMKKGNAMIKKDVDLMGDNVIINDDQFDIRSVIYTIRGVQVMLDRDLAAAYQVTTSVFNQAVKRNANRFPEGFRFQLSKEENEVLISQIVTSKRNAGQETRGGYHKLPYAFTEQGIAMLSGLRDCVANRYTIELVTCSRNFASS